MRIIRGKFGRRRFDVPTNISARPTTDFARENIFNVLENMVDFDGLKALDLFAGTGAITFEFLSRGCAEVTSVEKAATQYKFIKQVAQQLNCKNLNLIKGDAFKFIESCATKFDIIFADPPYAQLRRSTHTHTRLTDAVARHHRNSRALQGLRLLVASRILRPPHLRIGKFLALPSGR